MFKESQTWAKYRVSTGKNTRGIQREGPAELTPGCPGHREESTLGQEARRKWLGAWAAAVTGREGGRSST